MSLSSIKFNKIINWILKFQNNTSKYLFKGNAFRNVVENEDAPSDERDVEDSPVVADEIDSENDSNGLALTTVQKASIYFFKSRIVCDKTLKIK